MSARDTGEVGDVLESGQKPQPSGPDGVDTAIQALWTSAQEKELILTITPTSGRIVTLCGPV